MMLLEWGLREGDLFLYIQEGHKVKRGASSGSMALSVTSVPDRSCTTYLIEPTVSHGALANQGSE
jgi:hypothetical protein